MLHCSIYKVNQKVSQNGSETLEEEPGQSERLKIKTFASWSSSELCKCPFLSACVALDEKEF